MANGLSPRGACCGHCPENVNHVLSRKDEFRFQCSVCKRKEKSVWMFKGEAVHFCKKAPQAIVPKAPCTGAQEQIEGTTRRGSGVVMEGGKMEKSLAAGAATLRGESDLEGGKSLAVEVATLRGKGEVATLRGELESAKLKARYKDEVAERNVAEARKVAERMERAQDDMQVKLDMERKHRLAAVEGMGNMEKETAAEVKAAEQKARHSAEATNRKWEREEAEWRKRARLERAVAVRFEKDKAQRAKEEAVAQAKRDGKAKRNLSRDRCMQKRRKTGEDAVVIDADREGATEVDSENVPDATEGVHGVGNYAVY